VNNKKPLIIDCLHNKVHPFSMSSLDYRKGFFYGVPDLLPDKLQRLQNVAARVQVKASYSGLNSPY